MSDRAVLAIDQGTTNTKVVLVDDAGRVRARASRRLALGLPRPGWVELDPAAVLASVFEAVDECLARGGDPPVAAVGISNQRESVALWNRRSGTPVGPIVVWQCRRSAPQCDDVRARGLAPLVRARAGLTLDPVLSAGKLRWLLEETPHARVDDLAAGTIDSLVAWALSDGAVHACDVSNASRTGLMNVNTGDWDPELLSAWRVPAALLPRIVPSSGVVATTRPRGRLAGGVPIAALIGDSHAALFGHGICDPGVLKATYGTGSSLMTRTKGPVTSDRGLSTTVAWQLGGEPIAHALEGNIVATGAAVQWVAELLGFDGEDASERVARLATTVPSSDGVCFVPAFVGLGAPWWDAEARGALTGLTRGAGRAHVARAAIDAIAFQVRDVYSTMDIESGADGALLLADGGASANDALMQLQADLLGRPVLRARDPDVSARGAALLAGLAVGQWRSLDDVRALPHDHDRFEPHMPAGERDRLVANWRSAVARVLTSRSAD